MERIAGIEKPLHIRQRPGPFTRKEVFSMKRSQYQFGTLYPEPRKKGPDVWVYRWRETSAEGKRQLRKQILGTVRQFRTEGEAQRAAEAYRLSVNRHAAENGGPPQTVQKLVEHYRIKELPMNTHEDKTKKTKLVYSGNLKLYIVPRWGDYPLRRVTSVEVEAWLKTLKLAPSSRAKIRNLMSTVFRHAIRWGWLNQNENPIAMVRVSSKRRQVPVTLTAEEFRALFAVLPDRGAGHGHDLRHGGASHQRDHRPEVGRHRLSGGASQCAPFRGRGCRGALQNGNLTATCTARCLDAR